MKILVTGATGFIGSHLTRKLLSEGHNVGIIKRTGSDIWRIKDVYESLTVFDADLSDTESVSKAVSSFRPDIVYHLAAHYVVEHHPADIPLLYNTNVLGLANLLDASVNNGVRLFVNTSTCYVYDRNAFGLERKDTINPVNLYASTKLHGEQLCDYYSAHGLKCVTFRLFPPYGEFDNPRKFIPFVIQSALGGEMTELKTTIGFQKLDYIYVGDIVDAYMSLLPVYTVNHLVSGAPTSHDIFDIGTGYAPTLRTVVDLILNTLNSKINPVWGALPYRNNEVFYACADTSAAERVLGWKSKTNLYKGLKNTIFWYQNRKEDLNI